jgi:uncharacterized membrane protein
MCPEVKMDGLGKIVGCGRLRFERETIARLYNYLWMIILEQTWDNVFVFVTYPHVVSALVLWAIGWSMIALAGLVYLPRVVTGGFSWR